MKSFYKLLNKKTFLILIFFTLFSQPSFSQTQDVWKKSQDIDNSPKINNTKELPSTIFNTTNKINLSIKNVLQDKINENNKENIFGIYDPEITGISLDFWKNTDPDIFQNLSVKIIENKDNVVLQQLIKKIFFSKINLSSFPDRGVAYLDFISFLLAKSKNIQLIDEVIDQNNLLLNNKKLLKFLVDYHFSSFEIDKACKYAEEMGADIQDYELLKFKVFCLAYSKKNKKASANLELMKETGFEDEFFSEKINYLNSNFLSRPGEINTENLINIHLSYLTVKDFNPSYKVFGKNIITKKYFFKGPLFKKLIIDFDKQYQTEEDFDLINFLEDASNLDLYDADLVLKLYKKIVFNIDDLLNPLDNFSKYNNVKGRALLYQAVLLSQKNEKKLLYIKKLNKLYQKSEIALLGSKMFFKLTSDMNIKQFSKGVLNNIEIIQEKKVSESSTGTINNKILHKSDLISLLISSIKPNKKLSKLANKFDKKIKKKKYDITIKDIALINLLNKTKFSMPNTMEKYVEKDKIYIPNKIYNLLDKKKYDQALLENLILIKNLKKDSDYIRNTQIIVKVFERLGFDLLKKDFIKNEFLKI